MAGKKKILLMSDDLRMHSGIATQSKEFVLGTIHHYDWVQLGGAINHPENGNIVDMSDAVKNEIGVKDAYLKIYPINGYGNPDILRQIMEMEKPDAILHFTIQDFGFGFIIWNTKFVKIYQFFIIIYGMIYQILYIMLIFIEVLMCCFLYQNKLMV